jgi:hypothetical protein
VPLASVAGERDTDVPQTGPHPCTDAVHSAAGDAAHAVKEHDMTRRPTRIAAVSAALVLAGALSATPALAGEPDLTSKSLTPTGRFCTVVAQPTPLGQNIEFTPAPVTECFDTLGEMLESLSGQPVTDPALLAGDPAALSRFAQEVNGTADAPAGGASTYATEPRLIGVSYKGKDYTGGLKSYSGALRGGCEGGVTYGFPKLSAFLQNNVISSMLSLGNCWSTLYDLENYVKGTSTNCVPDCAQLGSMDNRASSIVFRPIGTID